MANADTEQFEILKAYAAGKLGTRVTIERLGLQDYADLLMALGRHELGLPRPPVSPAHQARLARLTPILQPRLRNAP